MKVNFRKLLGVLCIVVSMSLLLSCDSDDPIVGEEPETKVLIPEKIVVNVDGYLFTYIFSYDNDLKMKGIFSSGVDWSSSYKMEYDEQGRISYIRFTWDVDGNKELFRYIYSGNEATLIRELSDGHTITDVYSITNQGDIAGCTSADGSWAGSVSYRYDTNGSLINHSCIVEDKEIDFVDIAYNDIPGIFSNVNISRLMALALRGDDTNFSFLLTWNKSFETERDIIYDAVNTYTYTTNSEGYPLTYDLTYSRGGVEKLEYTAVVTYKEAKK